jgi:hypothetical protein
VQAAQGSVVCPSLSSTSPPSLANPPAKLSCPATNGRPDSPPGAGHCHESGEQGCLLCALQIGLPDLASGSRLALAPIVLPPTFDWRSLSTEFALPPRSPSRPDRYAADASGSAATCARHSGPGRTGPDISCSRASRCVSALSPAPPPFSRAALRPPAIAGLLPCPLGFERFTCCATRSAGLCLAPPPSGI